MALRAGFWVLIDSVPDLCNFLLLSDDQSRVCGGTAGKCEEIDVRDGERHACEHREYKDYGVVYFLHCIINFTPRCLLLTV